MSSYKGKVRSILPKEKEIEYDEKIDRKRFQRKKID